MTETTPKAAGTRKSSAKPARSRSREFALQALYQYLVGGAEASDIDLFTPAICRAFTRPTSRTTTPCSTAASNRPPTPTP